MIDMKLTPEKKKEISDSCCLSEPSQYPYGLKIHLDNESFEKLKLEVPNVGDKMTLTATVEVCSVSQQSFKEGEKRTDVSLQIVEMELSKPKKASEDVIYKG